MSAPGCHVRAAFGRGARIRNPAVRRSRPAGRWRRRKPLEMVLHAQHGTSAYIVSLKPHSIAVSVDGTRVVAWDRGGRLYTLYDDGVTWRRGLSGQVIEKRRAGEERVRLLLAGDAADPVVDEAAGIARQHARAHEQQPPGDGRARSTRSSRRRRGRCWRWPRGSMPPPRAPTPAASASCSGVWASCRRTSTCRLSCRPRRAAPSTPAPSASFTARGTGSRRLRSFAST